jgi:hypothetical protein
VGISVGLAMACVDAGVNVADGSGALQAASKDRDNRVVQIIDFTVMAS